MLKVVNELTLSALNIQNGLRIPEFRNNTPEFVDILLSVWKLSNVNTPFKGIRLNDHFSEPLTFNDERFLFLIRVVFWLDAGQALPEKNGKLSK